MDRRKVAASAARNLAVKSVAVEDIIWFVLLWKRT
jgi:hypothetical protein